MLNQRVNNKKKKIHPMTWSYCH